jgi:glycosyltransferase involved in cell wall biosynthesis
MKICHVAHGVMSIPPLGWGAIEALIWDYKYWTERSGHEVVIVNTKDKHEIIDTVNRIRPDVVHIHCEFFFSLVPYLNAKVHILTSHWPKLFQIGNEAAAKMYFKGNAYICCISDEIKERCREIGVAEDRLFIGRNGARSDLYHWSEQPRYPARSICLGAVSRRKRQYLLEDATCVDFIGPIQDSNLQFSSHPNYKGPWSKAEVYEKLTEYASLVLLSEAEVAPLVTCEALMAGLGVVVSEHAAANLDRSQPFISVIPEHKVKDSEFLEATMRKNREVALGMRKEIRAYAIATFDWQILIGEYLNVVGNLLKPNNRK